MVVVTEKVVVKGEKAHLFYKLAEENHGKSAIPKWNFHKIIIGKDEKFLILLLLSPTLHQKNLLEQ